jgi:hypothetical protein
MSVSACRSLGRKGMYGVGVPWGKEGLREELREGLRGG